MYARMQIVHMYVGTDTGTALCKGSAEFQCLNRSWLNSVNKPLHIHVHSDHTSNWGCILMYRVSKWAISAGHDKLTNI